MPPQRAFVAATCWGLSRDGGRGAGLRERRQRIELQAEIRMSRKLIGMPLVRRHSRACFVRQGCWPPRATSSLWEALPWRSRFLKKFSSALPFLCGKRSTGIGLTRLLTRAARSVLRRIPSQNRPAKKPSGTGSHRLALIPCRSPNGGLFGCLRDRTRSSRNSRRIFA